MTTEILFEKVKKALDELLPAMVVDGGGAELVSFREGIVTLKLIGSCIICPSRQLSAEALERGMKLRVPELRAVNIVLNQQPKSNFIKLKSLKRSHLQI